MIPTVPLTTSDPPSWHSCEPTGIKKKKTSLANALGSIAVSALLARRTPASFNASCELVADLAAAAASAGTDRGSVLRMTIGQRGSGRLWWLLHSNRDTAELRAVFTALQQHLGWTAQQAGAALLGLGLQSGPDGMQRVTSEGDPALELHHTSAQHIEQIAGLLR